ncbi:MAG: potassium-transporting ATPase subunit KdpC [Alphaproteobacteria bacterium]|uniref:Potassium-transporting ATPase KdpC subunit n=1 Tax=Candidatus Nitrobium versatile TaxID=2884831 RepID=A0A953SDK9_9BACT|nr:potassium-transporting ATPase subunit KdpC [Candidatus Nitrobium versatile]
MLKMIRNAFMSLLLLTILTGFMYPLVVTGLARTIFPQQANGSLIMKNGKLVGSELLGQQFEEPKYFLGRLSATGLYPYNGGASSGSNRGANHPDLVTSVQGRIDALRTSDQSNTRPVPVDLVTASGSGLDPHISPAAAEYQSARVARSRGIDEAKVRALIAAYTDERQFGILGEPVVNVLKLNLALDELGEK